MKAIHSFGEFLRDTVNLNQGRVDRANQAFDTLTSFLKNSELTKNIFVGTSRQGSLRQGTIIRPRKGETEFDVDLLLEVSFVKDWRPTKYLDCPVSQRC